MFVFWIVVIVLLVALLGWAPISRRAGGRDGNENALDVLNRRYARGEIDREEYMAKKRDLGP